MALHDLSEKERKSRTTLLINKNMLNTSKHLPNLSYHLKYFVNIRVYSFNNILLLNNAIMLPGMCNINYIIQLDHKNKLNHEVWLKIEITESE